MPMDLRNYPPEWKAFSLRIRFDRARGACECTGDCGQMHTGPFKLSSQPKRSPCRVSVSRFHRVLLGLRVSSCSLQAKQRGNRTMRVFLSWLILITCIALASHVRAATMTPGGDLQQAVNALRGGKTLVIPTGTYTPPLNSDRVPELSIPARANGARIEVARGATVTIIGSIYFLEGTRDITISGAQGKLIVDGQQSGHIGTAVVADHITLESMEIKWMIMGIDGAWTNSRFLNLDVHHSGLNEQGQRTSQCSCAVKDAAHCGAPSPPAGHCHGTYFASESHDNVFDGGCYHDNEGAGLEQYGQRGIYRHLKIYNNYNNGLWLLGGQSDAQVTNNVIENNRGYGVFVAYGSNNRIAQNTILGSSLAGVTFQFGGSGNEVMSNRMDGGEAVTDDVGGTRFSGSNNSSSASGAADLRASAQGCTGATSPPAAGKLPPPRNFRMIRKRHP